MEIKMYQRLCQATGASNFLMKKCSFCFNYYVLLGNKGAPKVSNSSLCFRGREMVTRDKEIREAGHNGDC
jgi:hypothetical protein